jgi:hypothetical protein
LEKIFQKSGQVIEKNATSPMLVDEKILLFNSDCQINRPNQQIFVLFFIAFLIFYSVFDSSKNLLIAKINYLLKDVETNDL